ncbi:MAG: hypothetical protein HY332_12945 [Chloroflexi bacterium]|nr:hypothetical protein [Chloroflexota bacterium]
MSRTVRIRAGSVEATAELNESATADAVWNALPIKASASTWGDEIYFHIPVELGQENAKATVDAGDLGYWPPGAAFCIFFGPTPMSRTSAEVRPASPVNILGKI